MTDLARRSTVAELVGAFRQAEAVVRASFAAIVEAEKCLNAAFALGESRSTIHIDASHNGYHDNFHDTARCIDRLKRAAWDAIVERLELRRMMSIARWNELEKQLTEGELPDLTEENVEAFAKGYAASLPEMLTEAVNEVFEWLRPHHSEHKTNTELEVGRKVVLTHIVERAWASGGFRVSYYRQQNLVALENVFSALDGKGQISKTHYSAIENAIGECGAAGRGETPLFKFRVFRNGNAHIEFKRLDLLSRFNAIAGGMRLRPGRAA